MYLWARTVFGFIRSLGCTALAHFCYQIAQDKLKVKLKASTLGLWLSEGQQKTLCKTQYYSKSSTVVLCHGSDSNRLCVIFSTIG